MAMVALITNDLLNYEYYLRQPWLILLLAFQIWMLVDAVKRQEWLWAVLIFIFSFLTAVLYYFFVYRAQPSATQGFQLPGANRRGRIKELEAQIHHLDKAHHHAELGDVYFSEGKLDQAENCYRAAIERDPGDPDFRAHLGQTLLRKGKPAEARPLLETVVQSTPGHDYGHTMMAYAETLANLGEDSAAIDAWKRVLKEHSYARAKVQLAELYIRAGELDLARSELAEVLEDDKHAAAFQRKQEKVWTNRAKALLRKI